MLEFRWEHWMIVGILTPCIIALYLVIIMVAYHTFCKRGRTRDYSDYGANIEVII